MAHPQGFLDANGNLLPWEDEVEDEEEDEEIVAPLFDRMQRAILNVGLNSPLACTSPQTNGSNSHSADHIPIQTTDDSLIQITCDNLIPPRHDPSERRNERANFVEMYARVARARRLT
jgi:hypothetical protein